MVSKNTLLDAVREAFSSHQRGDLVEARRRYRSILKTQPRLFDVLLGFGVLEAQLGRYEDALHLLRRAVSIDPTSAEAQLNLGKVFASLGRPAEALSAYDAALTLRKDLTEGYAMRGQALLGLGRYADAMASYDQVLVAAPRHPVALNYRGVCLSHLGRHTAALASYEQAIAAVPDYVDAYNNRGNALRELKRYEEAIASFERVLELNPNYEYALGALIGLRLQCCSWSSYYEHQVRVVADVRNGKRSIAPFTFIGVSDSARDQLLCAKMCMQDRFPPTREGISAKTGYVHDRIRLAYVSSDLNEHPVGQLIVRLFELHDRRHFDITAISLSDDQPGPIRSRLVAACDRFVDAQAKDDRETAALLRGLEIDIAIDLNGYTAQGRTGIFAYRPAPIQVNYLGYPGTLGAEYIDYILADPIIIPPDSHDCYAEKVVYLPDSYQANDSERCTAHAIPSREDVGLPERGFVFCSFNNSFKITPPLFDIWMRLLRQVDGSVLWLLGDNEAASENLRREAAARGVAPHRVIFAGRVPVENHRARHRLADLFLDTLPYNAHTTASDALWAGVPIVTCLGTTFAGRVAASLLHAVGLPDLVTNSIEDYETLARQIATAPDLHAEIKARLEHNRASHALFDSDRFRRHIEAAYQTMWERYRKGERPAGFAVSAIQ